MINLINFFAEPNQIETLFNEQNIILILFSDFTPKKSG